VVLRRSQDLEDVDRRRLDAPADQGWGWRFLEHQNASHLAGSWMPTARGIRGADDVPGNVRATHAALTHADAAGCAVR